jgi:hypothetical protein
MIDRLEEPCIPFKTPNNMLEITLSFCYVFSIKKLISCNANFLRPVHPPEMEQGLNMIAPNIFF